MTKRQRQALTAGESVVLAGGGQPEMLAINDVRVDGGTQMRAGLDAQTVDDYAEEMRQNGGWGAFPPISVYHDGASYWLADGFHRVAAARQALGASASAPASIRPGTRRDAMLAAAAANLTHGLRRTAQDKRRAVLALLEDDEWRRWSDREIARHCRVSPTLVGRLRQAVTVHVDSDNIAVRTYTTRHGTTATMDTTNVGKRAAAHAEETPPAAQPGPTRCAVCRRTLTDPEHVRAGIGPVCAAHMAAGGDAEDEEEDGGRMVQPPAMSVAAARAALDLAAGRSYREFKQDVLVEIMDAMGAALRGEKN